MDRYAQRLWRWALRGGTGVALWGMGLTALGQEVPPPAKASAENLKQWIADLDADSFDVREAAAERLAQAGPAAVDVLAGGVASDNAEIAWRSGAALERIAITGDEKTLSRIAGILDGLSLKGKPGLRSMAAEMRARQKHFRHDRAVASLKKDGAVFAGEGVAFAGGPIFLGGPVAIAIDAVPVDEPVIVEDVIEAVPEPAPGDGIFGLLGRLLKITEEPPARFDIAPPAPPAVPAPQVVPAPPAVPAPEEAAEPAAEAKAAEPAELLEEFQKLAKPPLPAELPIAPAADAQFVDPPPALPEPAVEIVEEGIVVGAIDLPAMGFDFIGGGFVEIDGEGGVESTASLMLGTQWRGGDDGLKVLKDVPEIWSISVSGAKITDASLQYIAQLPNLSNFMVRDAGLSRQGLQKLREKKPALQIQARGEAMLGVNADIGVSPLRLTSVFPDSGAYHAGLREGDSIVSVDGAPIKEFSDLTISIYGRKAGETIRVEYERDGSKKTAEITLKKRRDDQ